MSNWDARSWDNKLEDLEKFLREDGDGRRSSESFVSILRLVIELAGTEGLRKITLLLDQDLKKRGIFLGLDWLQITVLCLCGSFICFALERSKEETLVIRRATKYEQRPE